jgi:(p)ppGpp synthase/HD superfamily hydrolase
MELSKRDSMLALVQERHDHQTRNGDLKSPYWLHCYGVAVLLDKAIEQHRPGLAAEQRDTLYLAALGHDLYEDTDTKRAEIVMTYSSEVDELISAMTNEGSDEDRAAYLQKLRAASDETILIKLADVIENTTSVCAHQEQLGDEWIRGFFMPIIADTYPVLMDHHFSEAWLPTANELCQQASEAYDSLQTLAA